MSYQQPLIFYVLALLAVLVLVSGVAAKIALWRRLGAKAAPARSAGVAGRLGRALFQTGLLRLSRGRWLIHMAIFWGFVLLFLESLWLMVIKWGFPEGGAAALFFDEGTGRALLDVWGDVWGVVLLVGVVAALVRRYVVRSAQLQTLFEDAAVLWFLLVVTLSGFAAEGVRLAGEETVGWSFFGRLFTWVGGVSGIEDPMTLFWVHGLLSLLFIALLPFSKLAHAIAAPTHMVLGTSAHEGGDAA